MAPRRPALIALLPRALAAAVLAAGLAITGMAVAQAAAPATAPASATLAITVTGLHSAKGTVLACLWRDKAAFPDCAKSRTARRLAVPITAQTMRLDFSGVAAGRYAVTVEHDENGDGRGGRNFIGMPTEGVGVSNNPGGMPGWEKSLIDVSGPTAITVRIRYLFG